MTIPSDELILRVAARDLRDKHPYIGSMDERVVNLAAHVFVRFYAFVEYAETAPLKVMEYLGVPVTGLLRPKKLRLHPADIPTDYELLNEFLPTLQNAQHSDMGLFVRELMLDMFDYRIARAGEKSLIRRRIERRWHPATISDHEMGRRVLARAILQDHPQCTSRLIVAGPRCAMSGFLCDVVCDAAVFAPSALKTLKSTISGSLASGAYREALIVWLTNIDSANPRESVFIPQWAREMEGVSENLVLEGRATAICHECGSPVAPSKIKKLYGNERNQWFCDRGHILKDEESEIISIHD